MEWAQFVSLFATMLAGFGFLYREMKSIEGGIREEMIIQSKRSDRLYEMFIDLLKDQKSKTN